jgi:hypothetical protein
MVAITGAVVVLVAMKEAILPAPFAAKPIDGVLLDQLNTTLLPPLPPLGLVNVIGADGEPLHKTWLATALAVAVGLTVMVNVLDVPTQLTPPFIKVGVTVMVATTGAVVVLVAINVGMLPTPFAARPIDGVLFVQLNATVPPVAGLLNVIAAVDEPLQSTWLATRFTVATGLTVIVNVIGKPAQPFGDIGVTVIVAVMALVKLLAVTKLGMLPIPVAAKPMDGLLFTQVYEVPATPLVNTIGNVVALAQCIWLEIAFTLPVGFTVMVNVLDVPTQLTPALVKVGVIVIVAVTGVLVTLVAINEAILPAPVAAKPIEGVLLTQL